MSFDEPSAIDPETTPLIAELTARGHRIGVADETNFEYGLNCILDNAGRLIDQRRRPVRKAAKSTAKAATPRRKAPTRRA